MKRMLLTLVCTYAACGGDGGPKNTRPTTTPAAAGAGAAAPPPPPTGAVGQSSALTTYAKFEDQCSIPKVDRTKTPPVQVNLDGQPIPQGQPPVMVPDPSCCPQTKPVTEKDASGKEHVTAILCLREQLNDEEFKPDKTGDVNRDPFHSYVVDTGPEQPEHPETNQTPIKDECESAKTVARDYGLRDLKLVGIVSKGTKSYSLWVDSQQTGYRAKRNDCLSKDHAKIKDIGDNVVILQILPPPGSTITEVREETISLHPEDDQLNNQLNVGSKDED